MTKHFHTIDGETLINQPLSPIRIVVEGLLSHGQHLLAGAPKSGKSWLALWLSVTVAKGDEVTRAGRTAPVRPCVPFCKAAGASIPHNACKEPCRGFVGDVQNKSDTAKQRENDPPVCWRS